MIAVPVHEVVSVSPVLLPQLFHNLLDLMLSEVCVAEVETLLVPELLSQLPRLPAPSLQLQVKVTITQGRGGHCHEAQWVGGAAQTH